MVFFTDLSFGVFVVFFIGFFILGALALRYLQERRLRARLQVELNGLLYEYVPLEGNEIETISFINAQSHRSSSGSKGSADAGYAKV